MDRNAFQAHLLLSVEAFGVIIKPLLAFLLSNVHHRRLALVEALQSTVHGWNASYNVNIYTMWHTAWHIVI